MNKENCKCVGMLTDEKWSTKIDYMRRVYDPNGVSPTVATVTGGGMEIKIMERQEQIRIRKLTARECWRLMDFDNADYDAAASVNSESQLYKQAGNSIVVNVLVAIFGQMFEGKENEYKRQKGEQKHDTDAKAETERGTGEDEARGA